MHDIQEHLKGVLTKHNTAYRLGFPTISDQEYDRLMDTYSKLYDERLVLMDVLAYGNVIKLPFVMGSLNKIKTLQEVLKWVGDYEGKFVVSGKFDGMSIEAGVGHAMTRGEDGINGTVVTHQFSLTKEAQFYLNEDEFVRGEAVISWAKFKKYLEPLGYSHPRNAASGLMTSKEPNPELMKHIDFMPFAYCEGGRNNRIVFEEYCVDYVELNKSELTEDRLNKFYESQNKKYPCDGLVISFEHADNRPGTEGSGLNPKWSRAYKHKSFTPRQEAQIVEIERNISKDGVYNPVAIIDPITIDGAEHTRINCDNEKFLDLFGIGPGSTIEVIKSGGIITRIVSVEGIDVPPRDSILKLVKTKTVEEVRKQLFFPEDWVSHYQEPDFEYKWDGVVIRRVHEYQNRRELTIKRIDHFLTTLKIKEFGESSLKLFYDEYGVCSIEDLLNFDFSVLMNAVGYGKISASSMEMELKNGLSGVEKHMLMAASGIFPKLGKSKLKIYVLKGLGADGLGEYAAATIQKGLGEWERFEQHIVQKGFAIKLPLDTDNFGGKIYCGTECRMTGDLKLKIEQDGNLVVESYNKTVTHLVAKDVSKKTGKMVKALKDGAEIISFEELKNRYLGDVESKGDGGTALW